jgi:ribonuclease HI
MLTEQQVASQLRVIRPSLQAINIAKQIVPVIHEIYMEGTTLLARPDIPHAGRTSLFYESWAELDPFVMKLIKEGITIKANPEQVAWRDSAICNPKTLSKEHNKELEHLIEIGVLQEVQQHTVTTYAHIFPIPKPDGSLREITETPELNMLLFPEKFKVEGTEQVKHMMRRNDYAISVDLKMAYYLLKIKEEDRPKIAVRIKDKTYVFTALPMGINIAPQIFTRVTQTIIKKIRKVLNWRISAYFDDMIVVEKSKSKLCLMKEVLMIVLTSLGYVINVKKSSLTPRHSIAHLGIWWDLKKMSTTLTKEKQYQIQKKLKRSIAYVKHKQRAPLRLWASMVGLIGSLRSVIRGAVVYSRGLAYLVSRAKARGADWKDTVKLKEYPGEWGYVIDRELKYWSNEWTQDLGLSLVKRNCPQLVIQADASTYGWGATAKNVKTGKTKETQGLFNKQQAALTHNAQEAVALAEALDVFNNSKYNNIQLVTDNQALYNSLKKGGSIRSMFGLTVNNILKQGIKNNVNYTYKWIPADNMTREDQLSRNFIMMDDWSIPQEIVHDCQKWMGTIEIDLFATAQNKIVPKFFSIIPQSGSLGIDSLSYNWRTIKRKGHLWAHPPWKLIPQVLQKCLHDKVQIIIATPYRPTAHWWPLLSALTVNRMYISPYREVLVRQNRGEKEVMRTPYLISKLSPTFVK